MSVTEKTTPANAEPAADAPAMQNEADIGSGEKSPGEQETDEMIKAIPTSPKDGAADKKQ